MLAATIQRSKRRRGWGTFVTLIVSRVHPSNCSQAQFSDDGTVILVRFSSGGSASSGLLDAGNATSGRGPGPCTTLLDVSSIASLGTGATCELATVGRIGFLTTK